MLIRKIKIKCVRWWVGEYVPYNNDTRSAIVRIGGADHRHWTAEAARQVVGFCSTHWQFLITTALGAAGLFVAAFKL